MLLLLLTSPHFSSSLFGAKWTELKDKDLACSSGEYKGELGCGGPCTSAEFCATAAETATSLAINYAVWRGDSDKGCYVCDLSDRGDPSKWAWSAQPGAVSFYTSTPAPSPPTPPPSPLKPVVVEVLVGSSSKETVAATTFVHRWKRSFGSGHASLALRPDWRAHLVRAVDELGLGGVRYHGLFDDDNGPVVEIDHSTPGEFIYNWTLIDSTWDFLVAHSVKPVVELSFMPAFIANCSWHGHCPQDPLNCNGYACTQCSEGVLNGTAVINPTAPRCHSLEFHYQGIKQIPPRSDYSQWGTLVAALAKHAIKRYGADEVRTWNWEVWNELWGMEFPHDYMQLYAASVTALKSVDAKLKVGGPATAGLAFMPQFVNETKSRGLPLPEFVSSHHYPTDGKNGPDSPPGCPRGDAWDPTCFARQVLAAKDSIAPIPFYLTEYNVGCCLGYSSHDVAAAAAFIFRTVGDLNDNGVELYSYWTFTDVFEEGGLPRVEFKNVYGMMTMNGIPKPAWRAFEALHTFAGDLRLSTTLGAQPRPQGVAGAGELPVLAAFATTNSSANAGAGAGAVPMSIFLSHWSNPEASEASVADRIAYVTVLHCATCVYESEVKLHVISSASCDPAAAWRAMGSPPQPTKAQLAELMSASEAKVVAVQATALNATATALNVTLPFNTAAVAILVPR